MGGTLESRKEDPSSGLLLGEPKLLAPSEDENLGDIAGGPDISIEFPAMLCAEVVEVVVGDVTEEKMRESVDDSLDEEDAVDENVAKVAMLT